MDNGDQRIGEEEEQGEERGGREEREREDENDRGNIKDEDEETSLLFNTSKYHLEEKNFRTELRSRKDVLTFSDEQSDASILLDLTETSAVGIATRMLDALEASGKLSGAIKAIVLENLLTNEKVPQFANTINSTSQTFVVAHCAHPSIPKKEIALARLAEATNLGSMCHLCRFVVLIAGPVKEKGTKTVLETASTFATLLNDPEVRLDIDNAKSVAELKSAMREHVSKHERDIEHISKRQGDVIVLDVQQPGKDSLSASSSSSIPNLKASSSDTRPLKSPTSRRFNFSRFMSQMFSGLVQDIKRRAPYYYSDYRDGFVGKKTWQKTLSTTVFLYFACLLPAVAFGVLNETNTDGVINVRKTIFAQMFGGLIFAIFGGQPLTILLTTAPISLYIKTIHGVCVLNNLSFTAMYAWVGLWTAFFLILYSIFNLSILMRYSSKFTEETFGIFITVAFSYDAIRPLAEYFNTYFCNEVGCQKDSAILYLLLMFSTLVVGLHFWQMKFSVILNTTLRTILADYSLPLAVLIISFFGSFVFRKITLQPFSYNSGNILVLSDVGNIPVWAIFLAMVFGIMLSLLFFMDQNVSSALAASKDHHLKKGTAYHLDLLIIAFINIFLSIFGLPWVHGAIPHSPLHVRALADTEKVYSHGHLYERVVHARETRVTGIATHALLGISLLMLPKPLQWLPVPVLYGVFLYLAFTGLPGNSFFERMLLLITEQAHYPPTSYLRRVPQRTVHYYTLFQMFWLAVLCIIGFAPNVYVQMVFGFFLILLLFVRHQLAPKFFSTKHLEVLD